MSHTYWSIAFLVLGACIGSFLNVVIYRWPRDLSILRPSRSFCPHCQHNIAWFENFPVLSYVALRGKCRACRQPISLQYPLVEIATALVFVMTYDAFFVARQRLGIIDLATDWPILLGHWALWAGMIAVAVMDLEAYMVDIRVTWLVSAAGLVAHALWTPVSSLQWIRPDAGGAALAVGATMGLIIGALLLLGGPGADASADQVESIEATQMTEAHSSDDIQPQTHSRWVWLWLILPVLFVAGYILALCSTGEQATYHSTTQDLSELGRMASPPPGVWEDQGAIRLLLGFAFAFVALTLVASRPQPVADVEIVEAIHSEAPNARRQAMWELRLISPAILLGVAGLMLVHRVEGVESAFERLLHWRPVGQWQPLWGLSTGLFGWIVAGAIGWLCRILFTLALGKEALGMGDVHIMAAAGAVAGWPVVLLGFFAAAVLTLLAMLVIQFRRQSRAVPYGPWLAIAFFLCCIFQDRILDYFQIRWLLVSSPAPVLRPGLST